MCPIPTSVEWARYEMRRPPSTIARYLRGARLGNPRRRGPACGQAEYSSHTQLAAENGPTRLW
jgi:hypothetical protein